jgi:hypothetical protein
MMNRVVTGVWLLISIVAAILCSRCQAREPFSEFLRALQKRGYGEQSLAYIDQIADRPDLPADLKETLDLERSK